MMACLQKFGNLPEAADPDAPTAGEQTAVRDAFARAAHANREGGAFQEACRCYRRAWELLPEPRDGAIPEFVADWAHTLYSGGRFAEALEVAEEALSHEGPVDPSLPALVLRKAMCLDHLGRRDEGQEALRELLEGE